MDDPAAQAEAETYLVHVLENSEPAREASAYNVTQAATEYRETSGDWDIRSADSDTVERILAKHAK